MEFNQNHESLESLPYQLLIKILCGVDHDDLKQLFHVSTLIRKTTLIVKKQHFEFNTPAFQNSIALNESRYSSAEDVENVEILNAPKKKKNRRPRISEKEMKDITVALFSLSVEAVDIVDGNGKEEKSLD